MRYKRPIESKGYDRILRIFSIKSLIFTIIGCLLGLPIMFQGKSFFTFIIGSIIIGTFVILGMVKIPEDLVIFNAGADLSSIVFNLIKKKFKKVIYVRGAFSLELDYRRRFKD